MAKNSAFADAFQKPCVVSERIPNPSMNLQKRIGKVGIQQPARGIRDRAFGGVEVQALVTPELLVLRDQVHDPFRNSCRCRRVHGAFDALEILSARRRQFVPGRVHSVPINRVMD